MTKNRLGLGFGTLVSLLWQSSWSSGGQQAQTTSDPERVGLWAVWPHHGSHKCTKIVNTHAIFCNFQRN